MLAVFKLSASQRQISRQIPKNFNKQWFVRRRQVALFESTQDLFSVAVEEETQEKQTTSARMGYAGYAPGDKVRARTDSCSRQRNRRLETEGLTITGPISGFRRSPWSQRRCRLPSRRSSLSSRMPRSRAWTSSCAPARSVLPPEERQKMHSRPGSQQTL